VGEGAGRGTIVGEPIVDVVAMAVIVRDMIAEGVDHLPSVEWLRGRVHAAGLGPSEHAALTTLRDRLHATGGHLLESLGATNDDW